jgi:hypothetical protein
MPEIIGSGVLIADWNRDGAPDLVLINGGSVANAADRPKEALNRLYLNDGRGAFTDATEAWGLGSPGYGMGGAAGDYDNDGWTDLYLTTWGGHDRLLRNTGQGFTDVTEASRIAPEPSWSSSAGFFDADNDGDLDLYVVRYVDFTLENAVKCFFNQVHIYCTPLLYKGVRDRLLQNNGDGTFSDVSDEALLFARPARESASAGGHEPESANAPEGVFDSAAWKGLALGLGDIDGDGDGDVYVANDTSRNLLFINRGNGVFDEGGRMAGVAYGENGAEQAGMGVDFGDVDGDERWDIACANFQGEPTNVYCQVEPLFFVDRADAVGVGPPSRLRLKFGIDFFDADNDGDEDLLVANGHIYDQVETFLHGVTFAQPNTLYEFLDRGVFVDVTEHAGPALADCQVSRGLATADLNSDGLLEYVVSNNGGTAQVAVNQTSAPGNFISLWLEGRRCNRSAIGAKVIVAAGPRQMLREVFGSASFLSAHDLRVHVGLADRASADEVMIIWPGGRRQSLGRLAANVFYHVVEGLPPQPYAPGAAVIPP